MIKNSTLIIAGLALIASCESQTKTEEQKEELIEVIDSTEENQNNLIVDEKAEEKNFTNLFLEDYGAFESREELADYFGEENIETGESYYDEGMLKFEHSIVTNPKNGHVVKVLWEEDYPDKVNSIEASYNLYDDEYNLIGNQILSSKEGIFLGMSLKDLVAWNDNEPIKFSGFAWDYHGGIFQNDSSKINQTNLVLNLDYFDEEGIPNEYLGDVTLSSSDQNVMEAPIVVGRITIRFDKE
ncbi:hypothetical protein [Crocinitomix algicola]|uniref:hypothetical protein n=1 Tax=Crocinitomix algicola TaxID=1740263 RepID=UPI00082E020A|nr:hypothetical protein [Crocinitomix algicola]